MLSIPKHDQDKGVEPVPEGAGDEVVEVLSVIRMSLATDTLDQRCNKGAPNCLQDPLLTWDTNRNAALRSTRCPGAQPETEHVQTNLEASEKVVKPIFRQSSEVRV